MTNERERERERELQKLKEEYKQSIRALHRKKFDWNQIKIIDFILDKAETEPQLRKIFNIFLERIKFGLNFEWSPEPGDPNKEEVAILQKDKDSSFQNKNNSNFENTLILGNNFDALNNLLITHRGKIDVIYIDPPYNTGGNNLGYEDKRPKDIWLSNIKERLQMAKQLLNDDGVIFVSIDDNMQAYLKVLMDEIFGEENFICNFARHTRSGGGYSGSKIGINFDYVIFYQKSPSFFINQRDKKDNDYETFKETDENGFKFKWRNALKTSGDWKREDRESMFFPIEVDGEKIFPINGRQEGRWVFGKEKYLEYKEKKYLKKIKNPDGTVSVYYREYPNNKTKIESLILPGHLNSKGTEDVEILFNQKDKFMNPKPVSLIKYLINMNPNKNAIVLDFYAGSGTTGEAVLELNKEDHGNRKFILCTLDEDKNNNIGTKVCYERLYRINHGYGTQNEEIPEWLKSHEPYRENLNVYRIAYKDISLKNASPFLNFDFTPYIELNPHLKFESTEDIFENIHNLAIRNWWI